mgnify:CR=1 FL=1
MGITPWRTDKWWVSPFNYSEDIRKEFTFPHRIQIYDTTLRDGEETPGVFLREDAKIEIARALDEVGIDRIETGMPGTSLKDKYFTKKVVKLGLNAKIFALCHAIRKDIDASIDCDVDNITFIIPIGHPKRVYQYKFSEEETINRSIELIDYAKDHGLFVVVSPYDTTRVDFDFLKRYLEEVISATKPDGVCISDTVGCALPQAIAYLVRKVKEIVKIPVEVHIHNDFGLATACSLAAVGAGAEVIDGTVNGLGEGTGVAAIEEVIMGLKLLYGLDVHYKIDKLYELSVLVEKLTGVKNSPLKPIVGKYIFGREFASALKRADAFKSLLQYPLAVRSIHPSLLGRKASVFIGRKSGIQSVRAKLSELGITAPEDQIKTILSRIKGKLRNGKALISDEEFISIVKEVSCSETT